MKCLDCPNIMLVDLNWPYCKVLDDYIVLEIDDTCHHCPTSENE